jgi:ABC-type glycerol-3-phosphate transport system substrate-binding protein
LLFGLDGWYYDANWNAAVNDEKGMKAIDTLLDMAKNATTPAATGYNFDEQVKLFESGNAAMIVTYASIPPVLDNPANSQVSGKIDLAVTPGGHGMQGGWGWAIPKSSPNPEAAWEFLKWVESFDIAKRRALSGGGITRTDVFNDSEVMAKYPWQAHIQEWIATGKPFPIFCGSQQLIDILSLNVSQALAGEKDPHQAMNDAAVEMNKIVVGDPLLKK